MMRRGSRPLAARWTAPRVPRRRRRDARCSRSRAATESPALSFLWIALLLIVGKIAGLVERLGQPGVLGELVAGVLLGNLALLGVGVLEPMKGDAFVRSLAELGVVVLLFQIGLESNLQEMRRVGLRATAVAIVGVAVPFVLGAVVLGPLVFPGQPSSAHLFFGATLTATSVGITARVFKDLRFLASPEARIVLGAAVIDDVIGLVILAVVSAIISTGSVAAATVAWIVGEGDRVPRRRDPARPPGRPCVEPAALARPQRHRHEVHARPLGLPRARVPRARPRPRPDRRRVRGGAHPRRGDVQGLPRPGD